MTEHAHAQAGLSSEAVAALVANHRAFLAFLERRVGSRAIAEDILHEAFVKGMERGGSLLADESAVAWFYRMLRNAVVDHYRRGAASARKVEAFARELETRDDSVVRAEVCQCIATLTAALKPEYAEALKRVEIDGLSVKSYAEEAGISANNAGVRVFRARDALRREVARSCGTCADHGCLDCSCESSAGKSSCSDAG